MNSIVSYYYLLLLLVYSIQNSLLSKHSVPYDSLSTYILEQLIALFNAPLLNKHVNGLEAVPHNIGPPGGQCKAFWDHQDFPGS